MYTFTFIPPPVSAEARRRIAITRAFTYFGPAHCTSQAEISIVAWTKEAFNGSDVTKQVALRKICDDLKASSAYRATIANGAYINSVMRLLQPNNYRSLGGCVAISSAVQIIENFVNFGLAERYAAELYRILGINLHHLATTVPAVDFGIPVARDAGVATVRLLMLLTTGDPTLDDSPPGTVPLIESVTTLLGQATAASNCLCNKFVSCLILYVHHWLKRPQQLAADAHAFPRRMLAVGKNLVDILSLSIRHEHGASIVRPLALALRLLDSMLAAGPDELCQDLRGRLLVLGGAAQGGPPDTAAHRLIEAVQAVQATGERELMTLLASIYHRLCAGSYSRLIANVGEDMAQELGQRASFQEE